MKRKSKKGNQVMEDSNVPITPSGSGSDQPELPHSNDHQHKSNHNKSKRFTEFTSSFSSKKPGMLIFVLLFALVGSYIIVKSFAASPNNSAKNSGGGTTTTPLSVTQSWVDGHYPYITQNGCYGIDGIASWQGTGTIAPGQTYTFNPSYPTCYHSEKPSISIHADWSGATQLKMETNMGFVSPGVDDRTLLGQHVVAPVMAAINSRQQSNLCMIIDAGSTDNLLGTVDSTTNDGPPVNWSITITNTGTQTASVNLDGQETNGYKALYYPNCFRADADGDHWNDSIENVLLGSNYRRGTGVYNNKYRADLADLNNDNVIDQSDVAIVQANVGQGDGRTLDQINVNGWDYTSNVPNPACYKGDGSIQASDAPWRTSDLDGDGCITAHDVSMVQALVGKPLPITQDYLAPWAANLTTTLTAGTYNNIWAFASDNDSLTHVDIVVNSGGKNTTCTQWLNTGKISFGGTTPLYNCGYTTPKSKGATVNVTIKVYDNNGHSYSTTKSYVTQ